MITFSLQSGSNGNSIYVEAAGVRLLFDAGISGRQAALRMAAHDRAMHDVDALIISHSHADHVCCAGIYQRRFRMPIYMTRTTYGAIRRDLGPLTDVRHFSSGGQQEAGTCRTSVVTSLSPRRYFSAHRVKDNSSVCRHTSGARSTAPSGPTNVGCGPGVTNITRARSLPAATS